MYIARCMGKTKTILVTGGAGFIGSHLCARLHELGHNVISLDDYSTGSEKNHHRGVDYRRGSTKDIEKFISEKTDVIYHLGEYPRVEQSFIDIEVVLKSNVVGTKSVIEFARKQKSKLVYAGSSTKFADAGIGRDKSPYAWTKAVNSELVRNYGEWFGLSYAITYFYNVYGPRERGNRKTGTVIGIFKEQYEKKESLTVRSPGTQSRNFTHVEDIVEGLILGGDRGDGDEYGLGHSDSYSIIEVANMFDSSIKMLPNRAGNRMNSSADVRRTELELGWKTKNSLPDYIKSILEMCD